MGFWDRIGNSIGDTFGVDIKHSCTMDERSGTFSADIGDVLGIDSNNTHDFKSFCWEIGIFDRIDISTRVSNDGHTYVEMRVDTSQGRDTRIELSIDRESGAIETATKYFEDGSRFEFNLEERNEIAESGNRFYSDTGFISDTEKLGTRYDSDGRKISVGEYKIGEDGSGIIETTSYEYDANGRVGVVTVDRESPLGMEGYTDRSEIEYHDNGQIAKIETTVFNAYETRDIKSIEYREDGTKLSETTTTYEEPDDYDYDDDYDPFKPITEEGPHTIVKVVTFDEEGKERTSTVTTETFTERIIRPFGGVAEVEVRITRGDGFTSTERVSDTTRTEIIRYPDGSRIERIEENGTFTQEDYDSKNTIAKVTHGQVSEVSGDRQDIVSSVEVYDTDGHKLSIDHYDDKGVKTESEVFTYDGDKTTKQIFSADGTLEKTVETETVRIDLHTIFVVETTIDGEGHRSEPEMRLRLDGQTLNCSDVVETQDGVSYRFEKEEATSSTVVTLTYDGEGKIREEVYYRSSEVITIDKHGKDTIEYTAYSIDRITYNEDGSITTSVETGQNGCVGEERNNDCDRGFTETTQTSDGKVIREISGYEQFEKGQGENTERRVYMTVTEYRDGETITTHYNVDAKDYTAILENPEGYDRLVECKSADGTVIREWVAAGDKFDTEQRAETPEETPDVTPDGEKTPDVPPDEPPDSAESQGGDLGYDGAETPEETPEEMPDGTELADEDGFEGTDE